MDETNKDIREAAENPIYTSSFVMSRDLFYDFSCVSYNRLKKYFLPFCILLFFSIAANIGMQNYDTVSGFSFISFLMFLMYLKTTRATKINYERNLLSAVKEQFLTVELFENKIASYADGPKREYYYNQITKFFETKNFLLLHLKYNLYILVNKNTLNADVGEVKSFLTNKCPLVKKKKFINCSNDKKWSLMLLIAMIIFSVLGLIISFAQ